MERCALRPDQRCVVRAGVFAFLAISLGAGAARSEPDAKEGTSQQSRQHFIAGQKAFEERRFSEALDEFEAAYRLEPRPAVLLHMGHAARRNGELERARAFYQRFLLTGPPVEERRTTEELIDEVDRKLAQATGSSPGDGFGDSSARPEVPVPAAKPEPPPVAPPINQPVPQPSDRRDGEPKPPSRWWIWVGWAVACSAAILFVSAAGSGNDSHASGSWGQIKL